MYVAIRTRFAQSLRHLAHGESPGRPAADRRLEAAATSWRNKVDGPDSEAYRNDDADSPARRSHNAMEG